MRVKRIMPVGLGDSAREVGICSVLRITIESSKICMNAGREVALRA